MLTARQKSILDFIVEFRRLEGCSPSIPEIQKAFGIRSPNGVAGHLLALEAKGLIRRASRGSRRIDVTRPLDAFRSPSFDLPLLGRIPVGPLEAVAAATPVGCVSLDEASLGFRPKEGCFAFNARGDSMRDAGILDGDLVIVEPTAVPISGQIVAAVIGGQGMLMELVRVKGKWRLEAANAAFPESYSRSGAVIQGVVRTVIRRLG